ncbi:MAG: alpha/beta hydrolase, partial [Neobacillus sp.]|nr:alpha/beta hydrolase [Neobacillus sp.]
TNLLIPSSVAFIDTDTFNQYPEDERDPDTNPNVTVYVEKGSFAESTMKKLNKTTATLDTIEKTSKKRVPVTLRELTVLVDKKPTKFTTFNMNGSNYFSLYDIKNFLEKLNYKYYTHTASVGQNSVALSLTIDEPNYESYNVSNFKPTHIATGTVSAMPQAIDGRQTGYIVENGCYMQINEIAKDIGFSVSWDKKSKMISIDTSTIEAKKKAFLESPESIKFSIFEHNTIRIFHYSNHGFMITPTGEKLPDNYKYFSDTNTPVRYYTDPYVNTYCILRELALQCSKLEETKFNIEYIPKKKAINIIFGETYIPNGTEKQYIDMSKYFPKFSATKIPLLFNGQPTNYFAYNIDGKACVMCDQILREMNTPYEYHSDPRTGSGYFEVTKETSDFLVNLK